MSSLTSLEKRKLEGLFGMKSGYVISGNALCNRTFAEFFQETLGIDIYSGKYSGKGDSKANHLRLFWDLEPDHLVCEALAGLSETWVYENPRPWDGTTSALFQDCEAIITRLRSSAPTPFIDSMKGVAIKFDAKHLAQQITRIEKAIDADPALALGTAKELVETCCKTILRERGKPVSGCPDMPALTKAVLKELRPVPESVPDQAKGCDIVKRLLNNLGCVCQCMAELRNLYGTGHRKDGNTDTIKPRHARLAVGAATTLATFLFETHAARLDDAEPSRAKESLCPT